MRRTCLLMIGTLLAPLERAAAQQHGDRVRLTAESPAARPLVGTLARESADSLWVELPGHPAPVAVARAAMARLEVSQDRSRRTIAGLTIGAGLGAMGGFVIAVVAASESRPCGSPALGSVCITDWYGRAFRGGLIGAAVGGALGAALGFAVRTERWATVPLNRGHYIALAPHGAGLALSVQF